MKKILLLCIILAPIIDGFGQNEILRRENSIERCLGEKISPIDWNYIVSYFETYLVKNNFGEKESIEKTYLKFLEFRSGYPPKELPLLSNRDELKTKLLKLGIIDGSRVFGFPFTECFYEINRDYKSLPESSLKDVISISDLISAVELSSNLIMGGLSVSLKESDFKKDIYKKSVILLSLIDMVYMEELIAGQAKADNPYFRRLQELEIEKNKQESKPITQDDPRLDRRPEPEGGIVSYLNWIYDNNNKLDTKEKLGRDYRSILIADVDESGNLINFGVWRGIGRGFDEEAYRLVKNHPIKKWIPGTINGKPVKVTVEIEVDFRQK